MFLEVGMGSGIVITTAAKLLKNTDCKFFATDINPNAIEATEKCGELNQIEGIELVLTNIVDNIKDKLKNKVDLILANPPFLGVPMEDGDVSVKAAWAAGNNGRVIIDKICAEIPNLITKTGVFYMTCIAENNIEDSIKMMTNNGFKHKIALENRGTTSEVGNSVYTQYILRFNCL